jgi:hypothetical protein
MIKSSISKIAAEKARDTHRKPGSKIERESDTRSKPTAAARQASKKHYKHQVAAEKASNTSRKKASKIVAQNAGHAHRIAAQLDEPLATQVAASTAEDRLEGFRTPQMPDSLRALAENNVARTRALYSRSMKALHAVLDGWERCLDAAGQGALALNRKIVDIAERNISAGFDVATSLAGAKNLPEVMEVHEAYWRKQFGELRMQAEEVRALSTKVTANVVEQIKTTSEDAFES